MPLCDDGVTADEVEEDEEVVAEEGEKKRGGTKQSGAKQIGAEPKHRAIDPWNEGVSCGYTGNPCKDI